MKMQKVCCVGTAGAALLAGALALGLGCDGGLEPWSGSPDRFEIDDSREQAREQRVHSAEPLHTFSPDGDIDFIRFRVTEVDFTPYPQDQYLVKYEVGLLGVVGSPRLRLWSDQGDITAEPDPLATPGVYYVSVEDSTSSGGEYRPYIRLWKNYQKADERPDLVAASFELPPTVALGAQRTLSIRLGNQGGTLGLGSFKLAAYLSTMRTLSGGETLIGQKIVTLSGWVFRDETLTLTFPSSGPPTGPVYVLVKVDVDHSVVESDESNNIAFASTLFGLPEPYVESEPESIAVGEVQHDRLIYPAGDEDLLSLDIDSSLYQWFEVWTCNLRGGLDTKLEVLDATETLIATDEDSGMEDGSSYVACQVNGSGTVRYYIRVTGERSSTGAYDILVRAGSNAPASDKDLSKWSWCLEPDDYTPSDIACGIAPWRAILRPGATVNRSFHLEEDVDWFVYGVKASDDKDATPARRHRIQIASSAGCTPFLRIFDAYGNLVQEGDLSALALDAGLYYVQVTSTGGAGTYAVSAQVYTP